MYKSERRPIHTTKHRLICTNQTETHTYQQNLYALRTDCFGHTWCSTNYVIFADNCTASWPLPCLACCLPVVPDDNGKQKMEPIKIKVSQLPSLWLQQNPLQEFANIIASRDTSAGRILSTWVKTGQTFIVAL